MKLLYTETRQSRAASRQGLISHLIHTTGSFYRQVSVTLVLTTEITSTEEYKTQEQTLKLTLTRASCMTLLTATYRKLKATEQNSLGPVYTIQPVVKPVVKPVWQPVKCLYTRYNWLSNRFSTRLSNQFDNRLYRVNGVLRLAHAIYNSDANRHAQSLKIKVTTTG